MSFRISGLPARLFQHLYDLPDDALRDHGAVRLAAKPGSPCRITLEEAEVGEPLLLLTYEHQPAPSPYRASGPIFVRQWSGTLEPLPPRHVPPSFRTRLYSVHAFDERGWMIDADVREGGTIETIIDRFFADPATSYLHLHHVRRGCYAARVDRT